MESQIRSSVDQPSRFVTDGNRTGLGESGFSASGVKQSGGAIDQSRAGSISGSGISGGVTTSGFRQG